jgi:hypothetical protein
MREPHLRKTTPTEPGTLRSWHEDSAGILPATGFVAAPAAGTAANALHSHYAATSGSGAGAAVAPTGLAECTGAGATNIHNLRVVLDYTSNHVYLTLSHYQYWALVNAAGGTEFVEGKSQDRGNAEANIQADPKVIAAQGVYTLMNPWLEVLVP